MKKLLVVLLPMILLLSIGQNVFAGSGQVELNVGYHQAAATFLGEDFYFKESGLKVGVSGEYNFTNKFAVAGKADIFLSSGTNSDWGSYTSSHANLDLFLKYVVFKSDAVSLSLQTGVRNSIELGLPDEFNNESYNMTDYLVCVGAYLNADIAPKVNAYIDLKLPFAGWGNAFEFNWYSGFFKLFLYDVSVGVTYQIKPNTIVGLDFNIDNASYNGINSSANNKDGYENKFYNFNISAKIGYKF